MKKEILNEKNFFLLYGANEGQKDEIIEQIIKNNTSASISKYDESEILGNLESFINAIYNNSFFEKYKLIFINRATDKITEIIQDIVEKNVSDTKIILKSGLLEKKSKLRLFFEKKENLIIIPFYSDDLQSIFTLAHKFFLKNKIKISSQSLNLIVEKVNGDRINLKKELEKILSYAQEKQSLELNDIKKLTGSFDKVEISDIVDQCILKNRKKINYIINENSINLENNILILKNFIYKIKRLKKIKLEIEKNKKIEAVLSSFRPPIFWKDKDIIKKQLKIWSIRNINELLKKTNNVELLIKKNSQLSNQILSNYILENI